LVVVVVSELASLEPRLLGYILVSLAVAGLTWIYGERKGAPRSIVLLHSAVSLWTAFATTNFAFKFVNPEYTIFLDWIVSTPLLIATVGLTASKGALPQKTNRLGIAVFAQMVTIMLGYYAAVSGSIFFFALSALNWVIVFSNLLLVDSDMSYRVLVVAVFLFWGIYPVVFFLDNFGSISASTVEWAYIIVPLLSKHVYSFIDIHLVSRD
jgi:bacteriorhodopsin